MIIEALALMGTAVVPEDAGEAVRPQPECPAVASPAENLVSPASYDVYRNGKKIGEHSIRLQEDSGRLVADVRTRMRVKLLFVTVFRYDYASREVWCGDSLQQISTEVDDNGTDIKVELTADEIGVLENSHGRFATTNHWNPAAMQASALFNTITGKVNKVTIQPIDAGQSGATTYAVTGDLNIRSTYDDDGNWLGMQFRHKGGSEIEFRRTDEVPGAVSADTQAGRP
ncbi:DUF6134 family protein [Gimibacter soli]|uniref:DUF6134 family protein n=1 Tax=Gimibacter soli TaxID=3024400 RepID=A0AAF0BKU8_9PROT|nr:DUF6134 family protein [Gimibacter soli]WCL53357.1 DUF6134 family protein [Gimibacter soli]